MINNYGNLSVNFNKAIDTNMSKRGNFELNNTLARDKFERKYA